jgi:RNA polymerase sigma factor FliA
VTEEIKISQSARACRGVVNSGQRVGTGVASVRRTESPRRVCNRFSKRNASLLAMLPIVKRIALKIRKHLPAHVEVDDLYAYGLLGLIDAVAKFDVSKRVKFGSYARHRVRGAILDGLRTADPATRELRQKNNAIQKLYRELEVKVGRPVHDDEMAAASGMNLAQWYRTLNEVHSAGLDCGSRVLSAGPTVRLPSTDPEFLIDGNENPFDLCYRREQRDILDRALSHLRGRQRQIISLRYEWEMTMKQIAQLMGVDESRISQLHSAALGRLKASMDFLLRPRITERAEPGARSMAAGAGS